MNVGKRTTFDNARRIGDEPEEDHDGRADRERDPVTGRIIGTLSVVKLARVPFLERRFSWEPKK